MKKLLNTLYISTPDAWLRLEGETVSVSVGEKELGSIPLLNLTDIVCFNYKGVSPALMGACAERGIGICFVTPSGRFLARVEGPVKGNVLLRDEQRRLADDPTRAIEPARLFVQAKIHNCRWTLERTLRDHGERVDADALRGAIEQQKECIKAAENAADVGALMGVEGVAAKAYFGAFDHMILRNEAEFRFPERTRRPPTDRTNALLSLTYTLLANEIRGALESVGLDPCVGFLHQRRPGRASLALDLLEEFRAPLADRFVLTQINLGKIRPEDFETKENGAVLLKEEARKRFLASWQERKHETIRHPFLDEKVEWGIAPYTQALLFARWLRGDLDAYPPFFWK